MIPDGPLFIVGYSSLTSCLLQISGLSIIFQVDGEFGKVARGQKKSGRLLLRGWERGEYCGS